MLLEFRRKFFLPSLLIAALLILIPDLAMAQRYHIQTFREQDGVASNTVYGVDQDSLGNMWFATRNGLSVYNGINWHTIRTDDIASPHGDGLVTIDDNGVVWWVNLHLPFSASRLVDGHWQELPSPANFHNFNSVVDLKTWTDDQGQTTLALATTGGHLRIWQNEAWITPTFDLPYLTPHSLALDGSTLLIPTTFGLLALDLKSPHEPVTLDWDLPEGEILGISIDEISQVMWIVSDQWLALFKNRKLKEVFPTPQLFQDKTVPGISLCQGPNGGLYFADISRVVYFHPQWGLETITPLNGVTTDSGNQVMMDREKNIWICSARGISKIVSRKLACYNADHGILSGEVGSILQRSTGTMVLGQRRGLTFLDPNPRTLSFDDGPLVFSRVTDLAEDDQGQLWISANLKGLGLLKDDDTIQWFAKEHGLTSAVYCALPHPDLGLFVGTSSGLFRQRGDRFEKIKLPGHKLSESLNIRRLIPLSTGGFVIASGYFGLFFWQDGDITSVPGSEQEGSDKTYSIFEHSNGRIWVATNSGLFMVNNNRLVRSTAPEPEIHRPIYSIVRDNSGRFWFGTDDGAIIWDGQKKTRLTAREGLLGSEINRDAFMITEDGHIWIGTDSGLSVFRPEHETPHTVPPVLHLTNMRVNGKEYPTDRPLRIEGPLASLVFLFHAPSFASEEHVQFTATTTAQSDINPPRHIIHWPGVLPMTNVPPGQFQVRIVARTAEGLETNTITTPLLIITPPLKERWYIQALVALAIALLMWLVFAYFSGRQYAHRLENEVLEQTRVLRGSEEVARLESERLKSTLESISDGVVVVDGQSRVVLFNRAAEEIFAGFPPPQLGCPLVELLPVRALKNPQQAAQYKELLNNPSAVRLVSEQVAVYSSESRICWLEISAVPITGSPGGLVFAFRDITNRRQTEINEHRSQKLESLGLLAGGIAHDFNNLLTIMMGNLSLAESTLITTPLENEQLGKIRLASQRAQNLTRQLLTFAKGGGPVREATNLTPIIQDSVALNLSGSNVDCQVDLPEGLCWAKVDADQLSQVVGNLVINARQAMSGGGQVKVSAQNIDSWPGLSSDTGFVLIKIQDHGVGISELDQGRIFDPYFTTKAKGTGLGLAIAHSIVEKHDGLLAVDSTLGQGSVFQLILPACHKYHKPRKKDHSPQSPPSTSSLKILFMDDEEDIRLLLANMLEQLDHQWVGVAHGESARDAYAQAENQGRPFDLVILDLTIPGGMGGLEALSEVRKINPQVKVIVASGYSDDPVMAYFQKFGFSGVLKKPFSQEDLQQVISKLTGSEA